MGTVDAAVILNTSFVLKVAPFEYDDTVQLLDAIQTALLYFRWQKGHQKKNDLLKAAIYNTDAVFGNSINGIPKKTKKQKNLYYPLALHEAVRKRRFSVPDGTSSERGRGLLGVRSRS